MCPAPSFGALPGGAGGSGRTPLRRVRTHVLVLSPPPGYRPRPRTHQCACAAAAAPVISVPPPSLGSFCEGARGERLVAWRASGVSSAIEEETRTAAAQREQAAADQASAAPRAQRATSQAALGSVGLAAAAAAAPTQPLAASVCAPARRARAPPPLLGAPGGV